MNENTSSARICVVGSANVDLTFRTPRLPRLGETVAGRSFHQGAGGKGANQAVAAARLGAAVSFIARVGNDDFGRQAIRGFQKERIDTSHVRVDADLPTGTAAILVDDQADNCIVVTPGANGNLSVTDVEAAVQAMAQAHFVLSQLETPLDATLTAFRLARVTGAKTILTPAPAATLPDEVFRLCSICVPNRTELETLTGGRVGHLADAEKLAQNLRARGVEAVVVTLGAEGSLIVDGEGATSVPAVRVCAVDPTGAGDAFTAALAVFMSEGQPLRSAAQEASLVAALTVTKLGAQSAFPRRCELPARQTP